MESLHWLRERQISFSRRKEAFTTAIKKRDTIERSIRPLACRRIPFSTRLIKSKSHDIIELCLNLAWWTFMHTLPKNDWKTAPKMNTDRIILNA